LESRSFSRSIMTGPTSAGRHRLGDILTDLKGEVATPIVPENSTRYAVIP
jgi:hypothetical protein